jgi:cytochrome c biogenesis protein CcmG, thiol:disulfide interchange protein DsbE
LGRPFSSFQRKYTASVMALRLKLAAQVLALLLVAGLLVLLGWKVRHQESGKLVSNVADGKKPDAPSFRLSRLDSGGHLELASLRDKVVLINFWATWCDPCKRELPRLQRAWRQYRGRDVVFVGVDSQDFDSNARKAIRRYGMTYPVVYDGSGKVLGRYGGLPLPRTFIVDRRGRIVSYHFGELTDPDIRRLLDGALKA